METEVTFGKISNSSVPYTRSSNMDKVLSLFSFRCNFTNALYVLSKKGGLSMKKSFCLILILLTLVGCGLDTKTLPEFYEKELRDVSKITIVDGNTGFKKNITDSKVIKNFLDELKDIKFIPEENQEDRDGTNYSLSFYEENEKTFSFSLTQVNGHYYDTDPDIYTIVDDIYKTLNNKEE